MALAAARNAASSSPRAATRAGAASAILWTGRRMPIPPVDAVSTSIAEIPRAAATAPAMALSSWIPAAPVIAFALPLLATMARIASDGRALMPCRTGAAHRRFTVNTPAVTAGISDTSNARSGRVALMPALTPANLKPRGNLIAGSCFLRWGSVSGSTGGPRSRSSPGLGHTAAEVVEPRRLFQSEHQVRVLHGLTSGALHEVVDRAEPD